MNSTSDASGTGRDDRQRDRVDRSVADDRADRRTVTPMIGQSPPKSLVNATAIGTVLGHRWNVRGDSERDTIGLACRSRVRSRAVAAESAEPRTERQPATAFVPQPPALNRRSERFTADRSGRAAASTNVAVQPVATGAIAGVRNMGRKHALHIARLTTRHRYGRWRSESTRLPSPSHTAHAGTGGGSGSDRRAITWDSGDYPA